MAALQLTVAPAAGQFMRRMVRCSGAPGGGFRLQVTAGGCSGTSSSFSVEPAPLAGDVEVAVDGLRLFVTADSRALLDGATVDFADTALQSGLTVSHPGRAAGACASGGPAGPPAHATVSLASLKRR